MRFPLFNRFLQNNLLGNLKKIVNLGGLVMSHGITNPIYIGVRGDNLPGSGSELDPLDGSTYAKLKAIFKSYYDAGTEDLTFILLPGTYHLRDCTLDGWALLPGWKIFGSGEGVTNVIRDQPAGGIASNYPLFTVFGTAGGNQGLEQMSIDMGYSRFGHLRSDTSCQAFALAGSGSYARWLTITDCGVNDDTAFENTAGLVQGEAQSAIGVDDGVPISNAGIEHCTLYCTGKTSAFTVYNSASLDRVAETTIAVGSNGATLPQSTIHVATTTGFPSTGTFFLGAREVSYTGKTSNTFTGCTGGTAELSTGDVVRMYYDDGMNAPRTTSKWGRNGVNSYNKVYANGEDVIGSCGCGGFESGISTHNEFHDCHGINADTYPAKGQVISLNYVQAKPGMFAAFWSTRTIKCQFLDNTFVASDGGTCFQFSGDPNGPTIGNVFRGNRIIDGGSALRGLVINDVYGSMVDNVFEGNVIDDTGMVNGVILGNPGVNTRYTNNKSPAGLMMIYDTGRVCTAECDNSSVPQTIADGATGYFGLDSAPINHGGIMDGTTDRIYARINGVDTDGELEMEFHVLFSTANGSGYVNLRPYKNGSSTQMPPTRIKAPVTDNTYPMGTVALRLAGGDYVKLGIENHTGGNIVISDDGLLSRAFVRFTPLSELNA